MTPRTLTFVTSLVVASLSLVVAIIALVLVESQRSDVAQLHTELAQRTQQLDSALRSQTQAVDGVATRLNAVGAKVNSTPDPTQIAKTVGGSVFTIATADQDEGTAWVISSTSTTSQLITNFHVVATEWDNGGRAVTLSQGQATFSGSIVQIAPGPDLALVSVNTAFPALKISQSKPQAGDSVVVIGAPLGLGGSVSTGIVSALRTIDGISYLQFTAPISPGNSGSPVVTASGDVIGIAEAKAVASGAEGLGLAIPIDQACIYHVGC